MNNKDFIEKCNKKHNNEYDYSLVEYKNLKNKINIVCKKHGIFSQIANNHLNHGHKCPSCRTSKGENMLQNFFELHNIEYKKQYSFNGCKNKRLLKFDFYLPKHNVCVEYDGQQHFIERKTFGGVNRLNYSKKLDSIKNNFCVENDIKLIRVKYDNNTPLKEIFNFI